MDNAIDESMRQHVFQPGGEGNYDSLRRSLTILSSFAVPWKFPPGRLGWCIWVWCRSIGVFDKFQASTCSILLFSINFIFMNCECRNTMKCPCMYKE